MSRLIDLRRYVLVPLLIAPTTVSGQVEPSLGDEGEVGAAVSLRAGVTWVSRRSLPIVGLGGTLRFSPSVELGGEAVLGIGAVRLPPEESPEGFEMENSYGGAILRWRPAGDMGGLRWGWGLLLGAGSARIRSRHSEGPLVSENYFLVEPRVDLLVRQDRSFRFMAEGGYRIPLDSDPLPGVQPSELRGPSFSVAVQYVRDP